MDFGIRIALTIYLIMIGISVLFQIALAMGVPWGEAAMGGKYPGKYPAKMRISAFFQAIILILFAVIGWNAVVSELDFMNSFSRIAIWFVAGFFVLGTILHILTPSKWERRLWLPVNIILLTCSLYIAINNI